MTDTPKAEWRDEDAWTAGWYVDDRHVTAENGSLVYYQNQAKSYRQLAADMDAIAAEKQRQADAEQAKIDEAEAEEWADLAYRSFYVGAGIGVWKLDTTQRHWREVGRAVVARLREQAQS